MTNSDPQTHVLIAGGGIGGLALALTLDQIGVPFTVLESVRALKPLGVGINLQPNAVRELYALGIDQRDLEASVCRRANGRLSDEMARRSMPSRAA